MAEFWNGMEVLSKVYFIMACVASLLLVIQIIMLIIGFASGGLGDIGSTDVDVDADADPDASDGVGIFTVKGLIAFFAIGGWVGLGLSMAVAPIPVTIIVSAVCGFGALVGIGFIYKALYKLQSSGNISIDNAVGKTAEVYLTIPANGNGTGKITLVLQERDTELEARTQNDQPIITGSIVKITDVIGNTVIVEPYTTNNN